MLDKRKYSRGKHQNTEFHILSFLDNGIMTASRISSLKRDPIELRRVLTDNLIPCLLGDSGELTVYHCA